MPNERRLPSLPIPLVLLLVTGVALAAGVAPQGSEEPRSQPEYRIRTQINLKVPMRDGVNLAADVFRPDAPGKFPTLLLRSYHGTQGYMKMALYFARRGYAVVMVDVRGRYDSDGEFEFYVYEPEDGYDTQQWVGKQSWCNGKIGLFGHSYNGFTQLMPAPLQSPHVLCMIPSSCQQTNFGHIYNDGVLQLNVVITAGLFGSGRVLQPTIAGVYSGDPFIDYDEIYRRLPLITALDDIVELPNVKKWIEHSTYDEYWKAHGIRDKYDLIQAPAYFINGWYGNLLLEGWRNLNGFRLQGGSAAAREGTKIIVGPWTHAVNRVDPDWPVDFGDNATYDSLDFHVRWYDFWLKGMENGIGEEPPIKIFVMGANQWRFENEWPLERTRFTPFYLHSGGKANSLRGNGSLTSEEPHPNAPTDGFVYDPDNPVPTVGGRISTNPELQGPRDRQALQKRQDILVYTSEPLEDDLEVTGPVELKLYAASSAVDTDFTAALTDVYPDGRAILICEGIRRASFRESLEHPAPIEPGKIYEYTVSLWETSNVFKPGHRIRLEVSSSDFPRYARNLNTGNRSGMSAEMLKARQTIHHSKRYPSRLVLPVIP